MSSSGPALGTTPRKKSSTPASRRRPFLIWRGARSTRTSLAGRPDPKLQHCIECCPLPKMQLPELTAPVPGERRSRRSARKRHQFMDAIANSIPPWNAARSVREPLSRFSIENSPGVNSSRSTSSPLSCAAPLHDNLRRIVQAAAKRLFVAPAPVGIQNAKRLAKARQTESFLLTAIAGCCTVRSHTPYRAIRHRSATGSMLRTSPICS